MADTSIPTDILDGVAEALEEVGHDAILRKYTKGAIDPGDPGAGSPLTPVDYACKVFLYAYKDKDIDGTNVLMGDRKALLDLKEIFPTVPEKGDDIVDGAETFSVVTATLTEVQTTNVVAVVQLRK